MMMGYGLINSVSQLVIRPLTDKLTSGQRREEMMSQMEQKHRLDLESIRLNKEIELSNNQQIQNYSHQCRLTEARSQFENQLKLWSIGQFNSSMWPLLTPFDHPSLKPNFSPEQKVPINIFLAKTDPRSPFSLLIQSDVKNRLSNFITTTYSNSQDHPTICRIGDWKDGFQDAAFINALWYGMQGQPSIVINPIQSELGELLDLNISVWGLASNGYSPITQTIISGAFGSAIGRIKKEETRRWLDSGLPISSPELQHNVSLLKQEDILISNGKEDIIDRLLVQYKLPKEIQTAVITRFSREYSHLISCAAGMFADIYHLIEYGATPYMPKAIFEYNRRNGSDYLIPDIIAQHYRKALTNLACSNYLQNKLPVAYLDVASSLSYDTASATEIFMEGVGLWANRKLAVGQEIKLPETIDECIGLLRDKADNNDETYLKSAANTLINLHLPDAANDLRERIISLPEVIDDTKQFNTAQSEWEVINTGIYHFKEFREWVSLNKDRAIHLGAQEAIAYITPDKNLLITFISDDANLVSINGITGLCIITGCFFIDKSLIDENIIEYDLINENFISNKTKFMQKKEFDSFSRLGKQIDRLVANLKKTVQPSKHKNKENSTSSSENTSVNEKNTFEEDKNTSAVNVEKQIADFFMKCNMPSMESEYCETVKFDNISTWIINKLPVEGASKAHILKTRSGSDILICIFFSNEEELLIDEEFPKKRILCNDCDVELNSFLNGAPIGSIKL